MPATATPMPQSEKKLKISGAIFLESLTHSMTGFGEVVHDALAPADVGMDTPHQRKQAVKQVQQIEASWLMRAQIMALILIFQQE